MATTFTNQVFTIAEVAKVLRVSGETIRRKIVAGELEAIEVSSAPRKTYRLSYHELENWLGADEAQRLFGKSGLDELQERFLKVSEEEFNQIINEATAWARSQQPEPKLTGRVLSFEEIRERFKK
jgi:excisionase family DNA binding protein